MTAAAADPAFLIAVWVWVCALGLGATAWMLVHAFADPEGGTRP